MRRLLPKLKKKHGTALVLSGGATKAFYFHLGVLKALMPEPITSIIGTSAGALIGAFLASGADVDTLMASANQKALYVAKYDATIDMLSASSLFRPKLDSWIAQSGQTALSALRFLMSLPSTLLKRDPLSELIDQLIASQTEISGLFDSSVLERIFTGLMPSNNFTDTEVDLYVTATSLDSRERAVFNSVYSFRDANNHFIRDVPIHRAIRASTAIPGLFDPVKIQGRYYVDGEIKQTLSTDIGMALADRVIISHTYQPLQLSGGQTVADLGWLNILKQSVSIVFYERIAAWRDIYAEQYPNKQIIWIEPEPDDLEFFLAPEFSFRPEINKQMIHSGELAALKALGKSRVMA